MKAMTRVWVGAAVLAVLAGGTKSAHAALSAGLGQAAEEAALAGTAANAGDLGSAWALNARSFEGAENVRPPAVAAGTSHFKAGALANPTLLEAPTHTDGPPSAFGGEDRPIGVWNGVKKGASQGAMLGFLGVLYPAVSLLSEGFGREMGRRYDGSTKSPRLYAVAGIALGVILYIPALVVGAVGWAVGAVAGGVAEAVKPGSTADWDVEGAILD